jgi:hypothetical protein
LEQAPYFYALNPDTSYATYVNGQLFINGDFGTTQGTVSVAGNSLQINSWKANQITADVPATATGNLVVTCPGAGVTRLTNPRQLSLWQGTVIDSFTGTPGQSIVQTASATFNLRFQQDIGLYYPTPSSRVTYPTYPTLDAPVGSNSSVNVSVNPASGWSYTGPSSYSLSSNDLQADFHVPTGSGTGAMTFGLVANSVLKNGSAIGNLLLRNYTTTGTFTTFGSDHSMQAGSGTFSDGIPSMTGTDTYHWSGFPCQSPPLTTVPR